MSLSCFIAKADSIDEINELLILNLKVTESEDLVGVMETVHSQSPIYLQQKLILEKLFPVYDLTYDLLSFSFIGEDDEYAYVRINFLTEKISGPQFQDNEIDALAIFKRENGQWKFWNQSNLAITFR